MVANTPSVTLSKYIKIYIIFYYINIIKKSQGLACYWLKYRYNRDENSIATLTEGMME